MNHRLFAASICMLLALCLGGCAWSIGGRSETVQPTVGRQLIDLQTAYEGGAITEEEYDRKKRQLLGSPPPKKPSESTAE